MVPRPSIWVTLLNTVLMFGVAFPALWYGRAVAGGVGAGPGSAELAEGFPMLLSGEWWLAVGAHRPVAAANWVFFANVDVLFWVIAQLQGSTWLIDPYWTLLPPMIGAFYWAHPAANADPLRSLVVTTLVWLWSLRLTHSYFRREEWQIGAREDWRFTSMRATIGEARWWWVSFFAAYVSQHVMLIGITLPLYFVYADPAPWHPVWDTLAAGVAAGGMAVAAVADTQLQSFKVKNEQRKAVGLPPLPLLDTGLWYYSRHPNYFGELSWWWGVGLFAARLGHPEALAGAAINTLAMMSVTSMVEERMMRVPSRREEWIAYTECTSVWVPLPKRRMAIHEL